MSRLGAIWYDQVTATWRSGYATVCKTVYSGSIPDVASTLKIKDLKRFLKVIFEGQEWSGDLTGTSEGRLAPPGQVSGFFAERDHEGGKVDRIWDDAKREMAKAQAQFDKFIAEGKRLGPLSEAELKQRDRRYIELFDRLTSVVRESAVRARAQSEFVLDNSAPHPTRPKH